MLFLCIFPYILWNCDVVFCALTIPYFAKCTDGKCFVWLNVTVTDSLYSSSQNAPMTSLGSPVESKASSLASSSYSAALSGTGGGSLVSSTYATASFISSQVIYKSWIFLYLCIVQLHFLSLRAANGIICVGRVLLFRPAAVGIKMRSCCVWISLNGGRRTPPASRMETSTLGAAMQNGAARSLSISNRRHKMKTVY